MVVAEEDLLNRIKNFRLHKVYFGWWTVLTGGLIALWGHGFHTYGFSALFKPISSELGFSRTVTSVAASIGRFEGGIEAPITGLITDRFGPRWIVILGIFCISLGLILMKYGTEHQVGILRTFRRAGDAARYLVDNYSGLA